MKVAKQDNISPRFVPYRGFFWFLRQAARRKQTLEIRPYPSLLVSAIFLYSSFLDSKGQNHPVPGRAPANQAGRSRALLDFCLGPSPAKNTQTEPGNFGYFGKPVIQLLGNKSSREDYRTPEPDNILSVWPHTARQLLVTILGDKTIKCPQNMHDYLFYVAFFGNCW